MTSKEIKTVENLAVDKDLYRIRWDVTYLCNYECAFCIQGDKQNHVKRSIGESKELREQICDKIIEYIEKELNGKYKKLHIDLLGGEVTIIKDFPNLLEKLVNVNFDGDIEFQITTNLSANLQTLLKITNIFKGRINKKYMRLLHITVSYYKDYTTEDEIINKILKLRNPFKAKNYLIKSQSRFRDGNRIKKMLFPLIKQLENHNRNVIFEVLYPLIEDSDYEKFLKFKVKNKRYVDIINYIVIRKYDKSISDELKKDLKRDYKKKVKVTFTDGDVKYFYRTIDISLDIPGGFSPTGMTCDAGLRSISINNLGVVSRCCCCKSKTIIGNILEGFNGTKEKIVCQNYICTSGDYSIIERI